MELEVTQDIKPVSELKAHTKRVLDHVKGTGRAVVITVKGRPSVVIVDAADYERQRRALNLAGLLARGEADVSAGHTRPATRFLRELQRVDKIRR